MQERAAMAGKKVGLILSGGNVDPGVYARALARLDCGPRGNGGSRIRAPKPETGRASAPSGGRRGCGLGR